MKAENDRIPSEAKSLPSQTGAGRAITFWVYCFAALLIALSAASLAFVANLASHEADRRALESEQSRFAAAVEDLRRKAIRAQLGLARNDKTFNAVQPPMHRELLEAALTNNLFHDARLHRSFILSHDNTLIASSNEAETEFDLPTPSADDPVFKIAAETRAAFDAHSNRTSSVFPDWYMPEASLFEVARSDYALIDGVPSMLFAVPILPHIGIVNLSNAHPAVLVSARYIDEELISELGDKLSFQDMYFFTDQPERSIPTNHLVRNTEGVVFGYFRWNNETPGHEIWLSALPLVVMLAAIIAIVAFTLATRISRLSASLEESERKNKYFARHDPLTGLPNRHHLSDVVAQNLEGLPDRPFALMACDLDKFKPVNDRFGHEAGDIVLCSTAKRIAETVGKHGTVSRIGGDEFLILLPDLGDPNRLASLARKLCTCVSAPIDAGNGNLVQIGVSIGIAIAPACGNTEKVIIRNADSALYRAKAAGRNTFAFALLNSDKNTMQKDWFRASGI